LAKDHFEDDQWGFGQIAALKIRVPILVELLYILNGEERLKLIGVVFNKLTCARCYRLSPTQVQNMESLESGHQRFLLP
jgi:hypothetical protein